MITRRNLLSGVVVSPFAVQAKNTNVESTFVMPMESIKLSLPADQYNTITKLFPNGIICNVSSIKTLLDNGFYFHEVNEMRLPWTGVVENFDGYKLFSCKNGLKHSFDDNPSVITNSGVQSWHKNGIRHRENGPAVIFANGDQEWYKDGKLHREDGPAINCSNGTQYWYKDGEYHRENSPAVIYSNGDQEWWIDGNQIDPPFLNS